MNKHKGVELLFTLMLFLVFVLGSFFMLSFGSDAYQHNITRIEDSENYRLPLSYLTTKVREAKGKDYVSVRELDGKSCLVISEEIDKKDYWTIIYYEDGYLYELFQNSANINLSYSERIMKTAELELSMNNNILYFAIGGNKATVCLY